MSFPPTLYLIGAQKAGTTYLATLLGQHPDICLSEPKEPHFFTQNWDKGLSWYRGCFPCQDRALLLDASPSYSAAPVDGVSSELAGKMASVPRRIAELSPDARFIYLLRDPVKRTYSAYWHTVRGGYEHRPFADVIRKDTYQLRMGCYYAQLAHYFEHFDRDRFKLVFFEEFVKQPQAIANDCLAWLGLEPVEGYELESGKNETFTYGPLLSLLNNALASRGGIPWLASKVKRVVPVGLLRTVRRAMTREIPPLSAADRDLLADYFAEHNRRLETELGLTLPGWTQPASRGGEPSGR